MGPGVDGAAGPGPGTARRSAPARCRQLPLDVAARVPLGDGPPLVVELLAACQADLDLRPAALADVEAERHERQALRPRPSQQAVDLVAVKQELPVPSGLVVHPVAALE